MYKVTLSDFSSFKKHVLTVISAEYYFDGFVIFVVTGM